MLFEFSSLYKIYCNTDNERKKSDNCYPFTCILMSEKF